MLCYSIQPGDFMEVVISPEIYQVQQEGKMKASLHLVMKKVVKIRSAQDAKVRVYICGEDTILMTYRTFWNVGEIKVLAALGSVDLKEKCR